MDWQELDDTYQRICAGRLCSLCEAELAAPHERGFRYCLACAPSVTETPRLVYVSFDHHNDGWSACYTCSEPPQFTYWQVALTDEQMARIVEQSPMAPSDREEHSEAIHSWGRHSFYTHMTEAQHGNLYRAWLHDPRNGYEKMHNLPAGASRRMRL